MQRSIICVELIDLTIVFLLCLCSFLHQVIHRESFNELFVIQVILKVCIVYKGNQKQPYGINCYNTFVITVSFFNVMKL